MRAGIERCPVDVKWEGTNRDDKINPAVLKELHDYENDHARYWKIHLST
jgi:hypothetical protein